MYNFNKRLGRNDIFDFPGWHRSFSAACNYGFSNKFDKIIHIESDAHLISEKTRSYFRNFTDGWSVLWCEKYNFPEMAIQVISGRSMNDLVKFISRPYQEMIGKPHENLLPYTNIEKNMIGERYGESLSFIPRFVDYAAQVRNVDDDSYYWWLNDQRSLGWQDDGSVILNLQDDQKRLVFGTGWSYPEPNLRWMVNDESLLGIRTQKAGTGLRISMHIAPMIHGDVVPRQRLIAAINNRIIGSFEFTKESVLALDIPPEYVVAGTNELLMIHPDARAPGSILDIAAGDRRELALCLLKLAVEDASPESYDLRSTA